MTIAATPPKVSQVYALLITAALWGAATGLLLPRAAYRLSVEPEEPWRRACASGHAFGPGPRGWLGPAACAACAPAPRPTWTAPAVTALGCAVLARAAGVRPELAVWLLLAPLLVLLATVDIRVHRLPDHLTLPLALVTPVLLGVVALLPGHTGSWPVALLGGLTLGCAYLVLFLINPNGLGFGDVKLAVPLGVALGWYGWEILFLGAFAGFLLGAVYGLGLLVLRRADRKSAIPFGPFMICGATTGLLLGALAA
ncbi:A24 family peptidase [Streptomyces sp. RY43-2]|uniref:A24 family peptidase n=1 Tax=Streptomyces macrolidinus TaxID=2952607 RepID=A0ABT0ZLH7_9ACTN|nr:A24 family peptidase [Streptomyces macrolidinus]MCN9244447.1 A24 family peptidase [Streptomyces macrolidinus]